MFFVIPVVAFLLLPGCGDGHPQDEPSQTGRPQSYTRFSKWGLSFDYPNEWREYPAGQVAAMKDSAGTELRSYDRSLKGLAVFTDPKDEALLLVMNYSTPKAMSSSEMVLERNKVYEDGKRAGDVTKVNVVKETTIGGRPAVEEDVERSNGGRGQTHKIIDGTEIFEISFIAKSMSQFSLYSGVIDHLVSTVTLENTASHGEDDGVNK